MIKSKKAFYMFICVFMICCLTGCTNNSSVNNRTANTQSDVGSILQAQSETAATTAAQTENTNAGNGGTAYSKIDVDLTKMSSTLIYSEVSNMMDSPNIYIGKVIKINGKCNIIDDPSTSKRYYTCIVQDATACCAKGIEFETDDKSSYPNPNEQIEVTGVFTVYTEGPFKYCTLKNAVIKK